MLTAELTSDVCVGRGGSGIVMRYIAPARTAGQAGEEAGAGSSVLGFLPSESVEFSDVCDSPTGNWTS